MIIMIMIIIMIIMNNNNDNNNDNNNNNINNDNNNNENTKCSYQILWKCDIDSIANAILVGSGHALKKLKRNV